MELPTCENKICLFVGTGENQLLLRLYLFTFRWINILCRTCSLRSRCIRGLRKSGKRKGREEGEGVPAIKAPSFGLPPTSFAYWINSTVTSMSNQFRGALFCMTDYVGIFIAKP